MNSPRSLCFSMVILLLTGCSSAGPAVEVSPIEDRTGIAELDQIIEIVLANDIEALRSAVQFTQTACTLQDGLGGPPKCAEGEEEGDPLEVLPILGPEGHFIRSEDIGAWQGLDVSDVYAAYKVSKSAYNDPNYPRGTHAIVFINETQNSSVTLQLVGGQIVRLDQGFVLPPDIPESWVEEYLIQPRNGDT
jgi:hypothetical protein